MLFRSSYIMLTSNAYTGALNERISEGDERNELRLYIRWKAALYNYSLALKNYLYNLTISKSYFFIQEYHCKHL